MPYSPLTKQQKEAIVLSEIEKNPNVKSIEIAKANGFGSSTVERTNAWITHKQKMLGSTPVKVFNSLPKTFNLNKKVNSKIKVFVDSANIIPGYHQHNESNFKIQSEKLLKCLIYLTNFYSDIDINYYVFANHTLSKVYNQLTALGVNIHFTETNVRNAVFNSDNNFWKISYEGNCDELIIADMPLLASRSEEIILFSNDSDYLRVIQNILEFTTCKITIVNSHTNNSVWETIKDNNRVKILTLDQLLLNDNKNSK